MTTAYDFQLPALDGGEIDFNTYRGKPLLLVNTASKCGFTPQYEGLQHLWSTFRAQDLVVIGIPSNDFGGQEPGSAADIGATCYRNYGVSFPIAAKSHVKGRNAIPLFKWLAEQGGILARPRWNFYKYVIDREGQLSTWFSSIAKPESGRVKSAVNRTILA